MRGMKNPKALPALGTVLNLDCIRHLQVTSQRSSEHSRAVHSNGSAYALLAMQLLFSCQDQLLSIYVLAAQELSFDITAVSFPYMVQGVMLWLIIPCQEQKFY